MNQLIAFAFSNKRVLQSRADSDMGTSKVNLTQTSPAFAYDLNASHSGSAVLYAYTYDTLNRATKRNIDEENVYNGDFRNHSSKTGMGQNFKGLFGFKNNKTSKTCKT